MINKRHARVAVNAQGLGYTHEQRYGMIVSLSFHSIVLILFLVLSIHKSSNDIKTFYIQFTQTGEPALQGSSTSKVMKKHKVSGIREKDVIEKPQDNKLKEEPPLRKELPAEQKETLGETDTSDKHEAVNVTTHPVTGIAESQQVPDEGYQGGQNTGAGVPSMASFGYTSSVIKTEVGTFGAPAFLRRQMPIYPTMARKLGKQGKVVLRLFINEKGRLLNVEVVEPAGYGFTESAVEAVKMSTFSPAREKGVSVASKALLTIRFVLKKV